MMHNVRRGFNESGKTKNSKSGIMPRIEGARDITMKRFFVSGWYEIAYAAIFLRQSPTHTVASFG